MKVYTIFPVFYRNAPKKSILDILDSSSIGESRSSRFTQLGGELNLGGIQVVILGGNMAVDGMRNALNTILRSAQMKSSIPVAVAEGNIEDIFSVVPENYPNVGIYIKELLSGIIKTAYLPKSDLHHVVVAMYTPGWHAYLPLLKAESNKIIVSGYGIFREDKLAHTITVPEARVLSVLGSPSNSGKWSYKMNSDKIPCTVTVDMKSRASIKISRDDDGYHISVSIKSSGSLIELVPEENYRTIDISTSAKENLMTNKKLIENIQNGYEKFLKKKAEALINKAQKEFKMDIFNWIKYAQAKWYKEIENIDWDNEFSKMDVTITVKAVIKYIGEET